MLSFEILCVTTKQTDFSKIGFMNIHSNVVFANQNESVKYEEIQIDKTHIGKMITTNTKGVGINRNISILYSSADICLLSDDDMVYSDNLEKIVLEEFEHHSKADAIIFNIENNSVERPEKIISKSYYLHRFNKKPFGAVRIAFRRASIIKDNIFFNTLFGGGCVYQAGEDSLFIKSLFDKNKKIYVSSKYIGKTNTDNSSWFNGDGSEYFYSKGAFLAAARKKPLLAWMLYYAFRLKKRSSLNFKQIMRFLKRGYRSFKLIKPFSDCE